MLTAFQKFTAASASSTAVQSRFVEVLGSKMHYLEQGQGKTILFIHGMPSSSYLWRNVIPHLSSNRRCIAVDLIGHGKSDSPDIEFRVQDHLNYLTKFIETLQLKDISIVGHSWGATLGTAYARTHEHNVNALSYLEPMLGAWATWQDFNPNSPQVQTIFKDFRSDKGWDLIVNQNFFLEKVFVNASMRPLSVEEVEGYVGPFKAIERRKAAWKAPRELPIEGSPSDVVALVEDNFTWMKQTSIPQLVFYTDPAAFFTTEKVKKFAQSSVNVSLHYLGKGVYNHAEDYPEDIGKNIGSWLTHNYTLEAAIPKFSFFTTIHKAIRKEIFETCMLAGSCDFQSKCDLDEFHKKLKRLTTLLREHSKHEDTIIHPLLLGKKLVEEEALIRDHIELENQLGSLERLFLGIFQVENNTERLEYGNNFYLQLNQFASHYLQHVFFEENVVMPILTRNYELGTLLEAMNRFKNSQSSEEKMASFSIMLAAINPDEALSMLTNVKKAVPTEVFTQISQLAQKVMPKDKWEKIDAHLSTQARPATGSQFKRNN